MVAAAVAGSSLGCGRIDYESLAARDPRDGGTLDAGPDPRADAGPVPRAFEQLHPSFSTTSPTFVPVPRSRVDLPPAPAGQPWVVWISAALGSTATVEVSAEARYLVDGVERGYGGVQSTLPGSPGSFNHFVAVDTSGGPATLELELRDAGGGETTIDQIRVVAFLAPPGADVHYAEMNPPVEFEEVAFTTLHTLAFTPSRPGEYVLFGAVATSESPSTGADVDVRWVGPIGGTFPTVHRYLNVRQAWQTFVMVDLVVVPDTTPRTVDLQAFDRAPASVRASHILAMRADAFRGVVGRLDEPEVAASSGATVALTEIVVAGEPGARNVILQSARVRTPCPEDTEAREARFEVGTAVVTSFAHVIDNCAYEPSYGAVTLTDVEAAVTARNVLAPTMGQTVLGAVSYVYALRL